MIPTAIALGLLLAFVLRSWWSIPLTTLVWVALVVWQGDASAWFGAALLGGLNAAVGAVIGIGLRLVADAVARRAHAALPHRGRPPASPS